MDALQQSAAEQTACLICQQPAPETAALMRKQMAPNAVWFRRVHRSCLFSSTAQRAAIERQGWAVITEDVIMQKRAEQ